MEIKSILSMVRGDWKVQTLFWSMLVCIGLIVSMVVVLSRLVK
jgi:hypothetical protein